MNASARAQYHFDHHVTKSWCLQRGRVTYRVENLNHCNYLPKQAIVGFLDYDELTGEWDIWEEEAKEKMSREVQDLLFPFFFQGIRLSKISILSHQMSRSSEWLAAKTRFPAILLSRIMILEDWRTSRDASFRSSVLPVVRQPECAQISGSDVSRATIIGLVSVYINCLSLEK